MTPPIRLSDMKSLRTAAASLAGLCAYLVATILLASWPATASAETFRVNYNGFRGHCAGADRSSTPTSISAVCNFVDDYSDPNQGFYTAIEYESVFKARADYTSLGAYVEAFNTETGPSHVLRTPKTVDAGASMEGTLVVTGGTGAGVLKMTFTVDGTASSTHPGIVLAGPSLFVFANGNGSVLEQTGTLEVSAPFTFDVAIPFLWSMGAGVGPMGNEAGKRIGGIADFYGSAKLAPFQIFDAGLNRLSNVQVTAGDGFAYPIAHSVPEPGSIVLFGLGLAAASIRRIRRRRASVA